MKTQSKPIKTSTKVLIVTAAVLLILLVILNFALKNYLLG